MSFQLLQKVAVVRAKVGMRYMLLSLRVSRSLQHASIIHLDLWRVHVRRTTRENRDLVDVRMNDRLAHDLAPCRSSSARHE